MAATDAITGQSLDFGASPNGSIYAQQAAGAHEAWQQAVQNIETRRANMYGQAGFKQNPDGTYGVDGGNLTGGYQQMERRQGQQIEAAHEGALSRNIGGEGIAAQPGSNIRYANGVEQANFANTLTNNNASLDTEGVNAKQSLWNTILGLQLSSIADARNAGTTGVGATTSSDGGGGGSTGGGSPAVTQQNQPAQATPGGVAVDSQGGYYDPMTGQYYLKGQGPAAKTAAQILTQAKKPVSGYSQKSKANLH